MKICVVGGLGNMGRRYCSILKYLGHDSVVHDIGHFEGGIEKCDGIIIATPTEYHFEHMLYYDKYSLPMLVEKPITKDKAKFQRLMEISSSWSMVNQYEYFELNSDERGNVFCLEGKTIFTKYDYFKSGSDGLIWDCINIIGLSKGSISINNKSPIWTCILNGKKLDLSQLDFSYIWMIAKWLNDFKDDRVYALKAHNKVFNMLSEAAEIDKV